MPSKLVSMQQTLDSAGAQEFAAPGFSRESKQIWVRPFQREDESRIRAICYATALFGRSMAPLIADRRWVTDALLGYHFAKEPDLLWVAETQGTVIGYGAGGADIRRQNQWTLRSAFWPLAWRAVSSRQVINRQTLRTGLAVLLPFWSIQRQAKSVLVQYPAFLHLNVDAAWQGCGAGALLLEELMVRFRRRGVPGVHISTGTVPGFRFFSKHGFVAVAERAMPKTGYFPSGLLRILTRKP